MFKTIKPAIASGFAALLLTGAAVANPPTETTTLSAEQGQDGAISEKVRSAIKADAALATAEISVKTTQGEVSLDGFVGSAADIEKAGAIAGTVEGVKSVKNGLKVK